MKKFFYGAFMFFAVQFGFAQGSQDALTYVTNLGMKTQIDAVKQQVLPMIDSSKTEEFTKEFDSLTNDFISNYTKLVDESYDAAELADANKKFSETKQAIQIPAKDAAAFEQKATTLSTGVNTAIQGLLAKYAKQEEAAVPVEQPQEAPVEAATE